MKIEFLGSAALGAALLLAQGIVWAGEATVPSSEDIRVVQEYSADFQRCLNRESFGLIGQGADARTAAELGSQTCGVVLEEMDRAMAERGFEEPLRQRMKQNAGNRGIRAVLPHLMAIEAQREGAGGQR